MALEKSCCVLSRGSVYISDRGDCEIPEISCETDGGPFRKLGNVLSCQINNVSEILGTQNKHIKTNKVCARKTLIAVNITLTIGCASLKNLVLALSEKKEIAESGSSDDRFCVSEITDCLFFPFSKNGIDPNTVIVTALDIDNEVISTLVADEDYSIDKSGITILRDVSAPGLVVLRITYDYTSDGFGTAILSEKLSSYKKIYFKGVNYSDGEGLFDAVFHKVLLKPVDNFDLISSDDFLTLTLSGVVEKVNGKFYEITKQES